MASEVDSGGFRADSAVSVPYLEFADSGRIQGPPHPLFACHQWAIILMPGLYNRYGCVQGVATGRTSPRAAADDA